MHTQRRWAVALLLSLLFACTQGVSSEAPPRADTKRLDFVERLTGGASPGDTLPLLVAIHGLGDRPEAFAELFADLGTKARLIAPRAPDPWGDGSSWYPIDDERQKPPIIRERARLVAELITHLVRTRPTRGKPVVTGFSQGGVLSFALAAQHSDRLRAAVPIAGALPTSLIPSQGSKAPFEVIALHGKADARIPFADGERTVRALSDHGYAARMQGFDGVGHSVSPAMREALFAVLTRTLGP